MLKKGGSIFLWYLLVGDEGLKKELDYKANAFLNEDLKMQGRNDLPRKHVQIIHMINFFSPKEIYFH